MILVLKEKRKKEEAERKKIRDAKLAEERAAQAIEDAKQAEADKGTIDIMISTSGVFYWRWNANKEKECMILNNTKIISCGKNTNSPSVKTYASVEIKKK